MSQTALSLARNWLDTPFVEGASRIGVGADCAGLIEGIVRELGLAFPARDSVAHDILAAASAVFLPSQTIHHGCLVLLSRDPNGPPLHAGIVTDTATIVHAHWSAGVVENRFGKWFQRRVTHIFAWPKPHILQDI